MSVSTKLLLGFILILSILSHVSCKKTDLVKQPETVNTNSIEEKFFNAHRRSDPTEKALIDFLKRVNAKDSFVEKTAKQIGYPRWDKAISGAHKKGNSNSLQNLNSTDQTFYIPFVRDSQNYVNASMIIHTSQTDTTFYYRCDWEYKQIENDPTSLNDPAEHFATFFMVLDKTVFGYKKFNITDTSLFSTANGHSKFVILDSNTSSTTNNYMWVEYCQDVVSFVQYCQFPDTDECRNGCDWCGQCVVSSLSTYCWGEYVDTGEDGGGTGGSGGGGGGGSTPPPCDQQPVAPFAGQNNLVEPCSGGGGWVPADDDPPIVPPHAPLDKLCSNSFNFRQGNDNSYWETNMTNLKFESSNNVNSFSAYYYLPNDVSEAAMTTGIYPSPFGTGIPPKSAAQYLSEFFPELFQNDIQRIWDNSINSYVWRFSKYAAQKIASRCSNIASLVVAAEYPGSCSFPSHTLSQISFRGKTESFLKCFFPTTSTRCLPNPSASSNTSISTYSPTCN